MRLRHGSLGFRLLWLLLVALPLGFACSSSESCSQESELTVECARERGLLSAAILAVRVADGGVLVSWQGVNPCYVLEREVTATGQREFVAALDAPSDEGAEYSHLDSTASPGVSYTYAVSLTPRLRRQRVRR